MRSSTIDLPKNECIEKFIAFFNHNPDFLLLENNSPEFKFELIGFIPSSMGEKPGNATGTIFFEGNGKTTYTIQLNVEADMKSIGLCLSLTLIITGISMMSIFFIDQTRPMNPGNKALLFVGLYLIFFSIFPYLFLRRIGGKLEDRFNKILYKFLTKYI